LRCSPANAAAFSPRDARAVAGAWLNIQNGNRRKIRELARDAQRQFERQEPRQKRRMLNAVTIELHLAGRRGGRHLPPTI
jgi:hypothetical protein